MIRIICACFLLSFSRRLPCMEKLFPWICSRRYGSGRFSTSLTCGRSRGGRQRRQATSLISAGLRKQWAPLPGWYIHVHTFFVDHIMYGKGCHPYTCMQNNFSIAVHRICMKFGVLIAANSGCLSLVLWHCSSFSFSIENVLVSRFVPHSKCTVSKELLTLITPHWKMLCG